MFIAFLSKFEVNLIKIFVGGSGKRWNNESGKSKTFPLQVNPGQMEALTTSERVKEGEDLTGRLQTYCLAEIWDLKIPVRGTYQPQ